MPTNPAPSDEFREQLSAWHDGALPDEASRFVLKRLLQDDALRAEVGRWQAVGDVLRRRPQVAVHAALVDRISAAIEAESAVDAVAVAPALAARRPSRRGGPMAWWASSAAAVGLAAVLAWPTDEPATPATATALLAGAPVASPSLARVEVPLRPIARQAPQPPLRPSEPFEAPALAASVPPLVRAPQPTPEQLAPLPSVDAPSRPWPRSGAPDGAFTVDYVPPAGGVPPRQ